MKSLALTAMAAACLLSCGLRNVYAQYPQVSESIKAEAVQKQSAEWELSQDAWLKTLAQWAGFTLPSNFVFFLLLIFVIFFSFLLTIHINEQNSRTESLAQAIAKLDYRLKKLEREGSGTRD